MSRAKRLAAAVTCGALLAGWVLVQAAPADRAVVDGVGRRVLLPAHPRRVVTLTPSVTEIVYALGAGDAVVGVSDFTEYPAEARRKPSVGSIVTPSIEQIVALHPDLVLATLEVNRGDVVGTLERLHVPVFAVRPVGLEGIIDAVAHVGRALDREADAAATVGSLRERWRRVTSRVHGLARPRVFVLIWPDPVLSVGRPSFMSEAVEAAGGLSVTADLAQPWPQVSLEEVVRRAPDTLVVIDGGHRVIAADHLAARPGWNSVPAVRDHRVIRVDTRFEHSSPVVFDAIEDLARQMHPDAFRDPRP